MLAHNRRVHAQTPGVGLVPETVEHHLADHLGHVVGLDGGLDAFAPERHDVLLGASQLGGIDVAQLAHPAQYVLLAQLRPLRVHHGIESGRCLGQPGEHRHLSDLKLVQRLAEIGLCSRGKTVGALAQEYLVDVELEDLVLGQTRFDLEGKQRLVKLPRERLFPGQEEIPGHLHRDRAGALARAAAGEVGGGRPDHAEVIHPAMLVEAIVLGRKDRLLHQVGHGLDLDHRPAFLAEFADQLAVGAEYPQRHLGTVVGQDLERGQVRKGNGGRERHHEHGNAEPSGSDEGSNQRPAFEHW